MRTAIIGGGVMGEVIARSLLERNIISTSQLVISEALAERRLFLAQTYKVQVFEESVQAIQGADLIIFCVKPQNAAECLSQLRKKISKDALVLSIMAGVPLKCLQTGLEHPCVIRAMPNIPAQIGKGMTVWMASPGISDLKLLLAKVVFQTLGLEIQVDTDQMVDAATAVSGSGPAYIFYIAEKLIEASMNLGFDQQQSTKLVRQTFQGAMNMWDHTGESPELLRKKVTSKKGTTEAAIKSFEQSETGSIFNSAVTAAYYRAKELGQELADQQSL